MSKLFRTIVGLAAVGAATAAGVAYYLKNSEVEDDFLDEFEDEEIEVEDGEREYVSLTPAAKEEAEEVVEEAEEACEECAEEAEEACEECAEEATEE